MKKRIILILSVLMLFVSCEGEVGSEVGREITDPSATIQEKDLEEVLDKPTADEMDHFISENIEEMPIEEDMADSVEKNKALPETQGDDTMPQETLAMEKGLSFQNDKSLLAVLPMNSEEGFSLTELDMYIKDFRILFFTTMDEGETEDFLLIPRYVGTTIQLYESGDEGTLPIYSYALDNKDVVLLRIGAHQKDFDYRIVVRYEDQEATWILSERQEDILLGRGL